MINLCKRGHHALLSSMDDNNDRGWMECRIDPPSFVCFSNSMDPTGDCLPVGSVAVPEEDVLADPADAARLLQEALTQTCGFGPASRANVSLRSSRLEDKQPKRRRSSAAGEKNKRTRTDALESSPVAMANFLAFEAFRAKAVEAVVLEARLRESEQEVIILSQEISPLRVRFDEARAKWVEVHNAVLAATEHQAASTKRVINLEAALNSKIEDLADVGAKHAQLEEKYRKTIEHNGFFSSTVCDLDVSLKSARSARKNLSAEVTQLKEELKRRATSLVVKKTYAMYNMRRKTLEEAKAGIIDIDAEIAKARELELAAKRGLPVRSDASGPSGSDSKFSRSKEESEDDDAEGQTSENVEPSVGLSTYPRGAGTSFPPGSVDTAV
ncbi:uncharacterized protein [Nicotiana tomentosiformis]|uniref:uncharacterized protein n=1 Tax=Nicotiana tomentosiformis TaxID=4098 RepID=UPI00388CB0D5